ncbi:MAG TPA: hypothetical protein VE173_07320, partial [Longimicrobiales bacterium]|nr:hypothetical protein [Longimicrobiales bacterium]
PVTTDEGDETLTTLWRIDPASGRRRRFASGSIGGFRVAPDRSAVAYLRKVGNHRQPHIQPLDGGEARRCGDLPLGAVGVRWMPDGRLLAMAVLRREAPTLKGTSGFQPKEGVTARATEDAVYRYWDMWLEHVYHPVIVDPAGGEMIDLTPDATRFWSWPNTDETADDIDVSPDGKLIVFVADDSEPPHRQLSWSLFLMNADGSGLRRLDPDQDGHARRPRFTPDGSSIVYGYQAEPDFYACRVQLVVHDIATGARRRLAAGWDRSPQNWKLDRSGRLLFTAEDEGRSRLYRLAVDGSEDQAPEPLTKGGWVTSPEVGDDGIIYVLSQSLAAPPEVHSVDEGPGRLEAVTDFSVSALADVELGAAHELRVAGAGGDPIQAWVVDPPHAGPDEPRPLVHLIHGG